MGRKVHPYGFRVGVYKDWQSKCSLSVDTPNSLPKTSSYAG